MRLATQSQLFVGLYFSDGVFVAKLLWFVGVDGLESVPGHTNPRSNNRCDIGVVVVDFAVD